MPQPATHYWVSKIALANAADDSFKHFFENYKNYIALGTSAPDLFYFPLMPTVHTSCKNFFWEGIADLIHHGRTYDLFCDLLDQAKHLKVTRNNYQNGEKLLALAFGFYCHVVTDCIFHPYVYRSTDDDWATGAGSIKESMHEYEHKYQEFLIDEGIQAAYQFELNRNDWQCPEESNTELLDFTIADALYSVLLKMYPDCIPTSFNNAHDKNHPVQQAYRALLQTTTLLFEGKKILSFQTEDIIEELTKAQKLFYSPDFFNKPYHKCDNLPAYTPHNLFKFSCAVTRKIFLVLHNFWNEPKNITAKEYFKTDFTNYLNSGNWNLDTGIQCEFNNTKELHEGNKAMNDAHIDTLQNNYHYYNELLKDPFYQL